MTTRTLDQIVQAQLGQLLMEILRLTALLEAKEQELEVLKAATHAQEMESRG